MKTPKIPKPKDKIYVNSSMSISNGSRDVVGGKATVVRTSGDKDCIFVEVAEHPGHSYNWTQILSKDQSN